MSSLSTITIKEVKELKTKNGKPYFIVKDDLANDFSVWDMKWMFKFEQARGQSVDLQEWGLTITEKDVGGKKYLNIEEIDERPKTVARSDKFAVQEEKKASRIAAAMDRNEVMYAKLGACEIVANHPAFAKLHMDDVQKMIRNVTEYILKFQPDGAEADATFESFRQSLDAVKKTL